jgi:glucose-1-phosphate thymidylyltransferase
MSAIGVIPAAGEARRLQPLTGSKELVMVGGRPVLEFLVERMQAADTADIVVVTTPDKRDVAAHARTLGLRVVQGSPATVSASLALGLAGADDAEIVLLGFPDTVWEPVDGFTRLLGALAPGADAVLGVFESEEPERSDVVTLDGELVLSVDVKPFQPRSNLIWGCAVARKTALAGLERHDEPGRLFDELAGKGRVRAVPFPGQMIDIGTPEALARARRLLGP